MSINDNTTPQRNEIMRLSGKKNSLNSHKKIENLSGDVAEIALAVKFGGSYISPLK